MTQPSTAQDRAADMSADGTEPGAVQYRFRGTLRDGTATGGTFTTDDIAAWVEARWHQRWRNLTILRGNDEVGGINRRDGKGPLIWWAES